MKHVSEIMKKLEENTSINVIPTQYKELDWLLGGGFKNGDLTIIAGRQGNGTIPLISNIALNISNNNTRVLFTSFWRNFNEFMDGSLTLLTGIHIENNQPTGKQLNEKQQAILLKEKEAISVRDLYVIDDSAVELTSLLSNLRKQVLKHQIGILLIDSLDVLYTLNTFHYEEEKQIVTRALKGLAVELNIPIVILSKITMQHPIPILSEQMPTINDLKGINACADQVIFCYRPFHYGLTEDEEGLSTIDMLKLKVISSGRGYVGTINLKYEESIDRISDFIMG